MTAEAQVTTVPIAAHVDDSYGSCTICREYVPYTDEVTLRVAWPCAVVRLDALRDDVSEDALARALCPDGRSEDSVVCPFHRSYAKWAFASLEEEPA